MSVRHIALINESSQPITFDQLTQVAQALQTQIDRDFGPVWGIRALIQPAEAEPAHRRVWPIRMVDQPQAGLGVHLDQHHRPFAEVMAQDGWSITASHELLEMLVDPYGHRFTQAPDIDPNSDGHMVSYLVEVGDPCEVYSYLIGGVAVSDFITPEYYDTAAPAGTSFDFLNRLNAPLEVPPGCYISWQDPQDGRWHQKQPDGTFITAQARIDSKANPRDDRDAAFGEEEGRTRHDVLPLIAAYGPGAEAPAVNV